MTKKKLNKKNCYLALAWLIALIASFFLDAKVFSLMSRLDFIELNYAMAWLSYYASVFIVLMVLTTLFLWQEKKQRWIRPLWLSFFTALIITYLIKFAVARGRPDELVNIIWLTNFADYSFPSMHAASAFAPIAVLDREFPKLKWFWLVFAVLVAFSRLYFGMHYISDVVAGAFIGYFSGAVFASYTNKGRR